eukprot:CAMPEP_0171962358 /NCGR_PEP_ID=MMETSP0993-20121228/168657_1 /TAXON_ID=483369 /ORGANISM="non described non described, Strain CCMP2098" /LENGTH=165 /DNA_ID=CAMNT_0012610677 /DNA_START=50 /DNA_END=547 /DNA_ORIENTATION=-
MLAQFRASSRNVNHPIAMLSKSFTTALPQSMVMKRIFTLPDGQSAWGSVTVPFSVDLGEIGICSPLAPGEGVIFRKTPGSYDFANHCAPREQIIVNLNAAVDITTSRDGTKRLDAGEAFFVEDTHGVGHVSKSVDAKARHSLFLPVSKHSLEKIGCVFSDHPRSE